MGRSTAKNHKASENIIQCKTSEVQYDLAVQKEDWKVTWQYINNFMAKKNTIY